MRYEDVVRAAWVADPDFVTLCKSLYGTEATWETVAKDGPDASDVHVNQPLRRGKKRAAAVLDDRGEQVTKRRSPEIPRVPREFKRDDHGRFATFAAASGHAAAAGLSGAVAATATKGVAENSQAILDGIRRLRGTAEGRAKLKGLAELARARGGRTALLAATAGITGAVATHHGKAAYQGVHDRALLEAKHAGAVRDATDQLDGMEFLGGAPQSAVVRTRDPHGRDARTIIRRKNGDHGTVHFDTAHDVAYQHSIHGGSPLDADAAMRAAHKRQYGDLSKSADIQGTFTDINEDKHQVFGWASIVEKNGQPVVDLQGDYITIDELEKAAYDYVHKSRIGGAMHRRVDANGQVISKKDAPYHAADLIESFVVTPEKISKMGLPSDTPVGWWVGYKVNDPEVWSSVKSGDWKGFSIHGAGRRRAIGEVSDYSISGSDFTR